MRSCLFFLVLALLACQPGQTSLDSMDGMLGGVDAALPSDAGGLRDGGVASKPRVVGDYRIVGDVRQFVGFYDTQLATYCAVVLTTAGYRCAPSGSSLFVFSDAGCTTPATYAPPPACVSDPPLVYGLTPLPACGGVQHVYTLRAILPAPTNYYARVGVTCGAIALPAGWSLYAANTELDPTTLAPASIER